MDTNVLSRNLLFLLLFVGLGFVAPVCGQGDESFQFAGEYAVEHADTTEQKDNNDLDDNDDWDDEDEWDDQDGESLKTAEHMLEQDINPGQDAAKQKENEEYGVQPQIPLEQRAFFYLSEILGNDDSDTVEGSGYRTRLQQTLIELCPSFAGAKDNGLGELVVSLLKKMYEYSDASYFSRDSADYDLTVSFMQTRTKLREFFVKYPKEQRRHELLNKFFSVVEARSRMRIFNAARGRSRRLTIVIAILSIVAVGSACYYYRKEIETWLKNFFKKEESASSESGSQNTQEQSGNSSGGGSGSQSDSSQGDASGSGSGSGGGGSGVEESKAELPAAPAEVEELREKIEALIRQQQEMQKMLKALGQNQKMQEHLHTGAGAPARGRPRRRGNRSRMKPADSPSPTGKGKSVQERGVAESKEEPPVAPAPTRHAQLMNSFMDAVGEAKSIVSSVCSKITGNRAAKPEAIPKQVALELERDKALEPENDSFSDASFYSAKGNDCEILAPSFTEVDLDTARQSLKSVD